MKIIDLSQPLRDGMRGVEVRTVMQLSVDGWNATSLGLFSHCGTHMDAPRHFLADGKTIDQQALSVCVGPARVIDVAPAAPRQLISVDDLGPAADRIQPGERLLFRTDWHHRHGTPEYRDELPRISIELARWLAERRVALIGVEPPSVADVNNLEEVTEVHQTLLRASVVIVEGLANLDRLESAQVQFIALPLRIDGGDGSPVRAVAIDAIE